MTINVLRDPHTFEDLIIEDNCIVNTFNGSTYKMEKEIVSFILFLNLEVKETIEKNSYLNLK